jgi:hypothetical protein
MITSSPRGIDAGALDRMLDGMAAQRRAVGHVEAPFQLLARGVRAVETITALLIYLISL